MSTPTPPVLAHHVVHELIGSGGSADVWRADGPDGPVAVKVYRTGDAAAGRSEWRAMRAHAGPHIMPVLDLTTDELGRSCLTMPYLAGGALHDVVLGRGGLTVGECVTAIAPLARALDGLHEQGIVHGDVTPRNIMLDADGRPMLADLGAARIIATDGEAQWVSEGFVSPEVLDGEPPAPAADVYALGAVLWFCCTSKAPQVAALRPHLDDLQPDLPDVLVQLITACLAQTPSARPDAGDVAQRLSAVSAARPIPVSAHASSSAASELAGLVEPASITRRLRDEAQRREQERGRQAVPSRGRRRSRRAGDASVRRGRSARALVMSGASAGLVGVAVAAFVPLHGNGGGASVAAPTGVSAQLAKVGAPSTRGGAERTSPSRTSPPRSTGVRTSPVPSAPSRADVAGLLSCRASVWNAGATNRLADCLVTDSGAWRQDTQALEDAVTRGITYDSIGYTITAMASVRPGPARPCPHGAACLDATVTTSEFTVRDNTGSRRQPAHTDGVRLELRRVQGAWRLSEWSPAAS